MITFECSGKDLVVLLGVIGCFQNKENLFVKTSESRMAGSQSVFEAVGVRVRDAWKNLYAGSVGKGREQKEHALKECIYLQFGVEEIEFLAQATDRVAQEFHGDPIEISVLFECDEEFLNSLSQRLKAAVPAR
jgi:hypothetical protein